MMRFEVGHSYYPYGSGYDPVTVERRTEKTIWVKNGNPDSVGNRWMMRIKHDSDGNEIAVDSAVPPKWRLEFTYSSKWPVED